MALNISSFAFGDQGLIPRAYTADGEDRPPPLTIEGVPQDARSLALIVEDPDATRGTPFAHWLVYDIPPSACALGGGGSLPLGATEGINDFGRRGYAGPDPAHGRHRYVFRAYALDIPIRESEPLTKSELEGRLYGHVLDQAELIGTYAHAA